VSVVAVPTASPGCAKWLAGRAPGDDLLGICEASQSSCEWPSPDPGKEMVLCVSLDLFGFDIRYAPFVHVTIRQVSGCN